MRRRGEEAGWKRKPCFSLLRLWMNHVPTTAIRFSSLRGCWCRAERASSDVLESEGKGEKGAGVGKGQRPRREGAKRRSGLFFFFFPSSPLFPLLSLDIFN